MNSMPLSAKKKISLLFWSLYNQALFTIALCTDHCFGLWIQKAFTEINMKRQIEEENNGCSQCVLYKLIRASQNLARNKFLRIKTVKLIFWSMVKGAICKLRHFVLNNSSSHPVSLTFLNRNVPTKKQLLMPVGR